MEHSVRTENLVEVVFAEAWILLFQMKLGWFFKLEFIYSSKDYSIFVEVGHIKTLLVAITSKRLSVGGIDIPFIIRLIFGESHREINITQVYASKK